ncbi:MAG: NADH-quinone oxidoreductase subunit M, partial [Gemmataceae bacterium]|nr:NADH-quinone oxidoreductase subunit M [Gemmataceae bacterium]
MPEYDLLLMSLLIFLPSAFALALLFFPRGSEKAMLWWSLLGTAATMGVSIAVFISWKANTVDTAVPFNDPGKRQMTTLDYRALGTRAAIDITPKSEDWVGRADWIPRFSIEYYLGLDGISMPLVLLTTALCFVSMIASFNIKRYESPERFVRGYCMLFLVLETGMLGTFLALDFFLFYIFWEVMLLPMYFLIGIWGGPRREYAAIKFFLYTLLGSVFILIALLGFYFTDMRDFAPKGMVDEAVARLRTEKPSLTEAQAREQAKVHTFDLLVMARAGKAALEYLGNDRDISKVSIAV